MGKIVLGASIVLIQAAILWPAYAVLMAHVRPWMIQIMMDGGASAASAEFVSGLQLCLAVFGLLVSFVVSLMCLVDALMKEMTNG